MGMFGQQKKHGLVILWIDVPSEDEEEFNHRYNEEHLEEVLVVPGVLNAGSIRSGMNGTAGYMYPILRGPVHSRGPSNIELQFPRRTDCSPPCRPGLLRRPMK